MSEEPLDIAEMGIRRKPRRARPHRPGNHRSRIFVAIILVALACGTVTFLAVTVSGRPHLMPVTSSTPALANHESSLVGQMTASYRQIQAHAELAEDASPVNMRTLVVWFRSGACVSAVVSYNAAAEFLTTVQLAATGLPFLLNLPRTCGTWLPPARTS